MMVMMSWLARYCVHDMSPLFQVAIVAGFHLFPFRTEKLSPPAPMVLHTRGRVGSCRFFRRELSSTELGSLFFCYARYLVLNCKGVGDDVSGQ